MTLSNDVLGIKLPANREFLTDNKKTHLPLANDPK
jgi:hypothetical protein